MSKPIVYIFDTSAAGGTDFELAGQLSDYTDLEFTRVWAAPGSFSIKVHADLLGASHIKENRIIYIDEKRNGWIESVEETRSKDKSNEYIVASGVELKDMLYRWTLPPAGEDTDNYVAEKTETVVKSLINQKRWKWCGGE